MPWKSEKRSLREILIAVVREGNIQIVPDRFSNTYFHWVENLRDWFSANLVGPQVPVWYREKEILQKFKSVLPQMGRAESG